MNYVPEIKKITLRTQEQTKPKMYILKIQLQLQAKSFWEN